jgi:hypothetical protein
MESKIYTLYLSTTQEAFQQAIPTNKTNLGNVSWNINFDDIFKGNQKLYKNCRVRYSLKSIRGSLVWLNNIGFLGCSLSSSFNSIHTGYITILGLISPINCPDTAETGAIYDLSTFDQKGVDINIPSSSSYLTISFVKYSDLTIMSSIADYQIILYFELY